VLGGAEDEEAAPPQPTIATTIVREMKRTRGKFTDLYCADKIQLLQRGDAFTKSYNSRRKPSKEPVGAINRVGMDNGPLDFMDNSFERLAGLREHGPNGPHWNWPSVYEFVSCMICDALS
jgi:hypothetical protein